MAWSSGSRDSRDYDSASSTATGSIISASSSFEIRPSSFLLGSEEQLGIVRQRRSESVSSVELDPEEIDRVEEKPKELDHVSNCSTTPRETKEETSTLQLRSLSQKDPIGATVLEQSATEEDVVEKPDAEESPLKNPVIQDLPVREPFTRALIELSSIQETLSAEPVTNQHQVPSFIEVPKETEAREASPKLPFTVRSRTSRTSGTSKPHAIPRIRLISRRISVPKRFHRIPFIVSCPFRASVPIVCPAPIRLAAPARAPIPWTQPPPRRAPRPTVYLIAAAA
ncbi:hypothetical protein BGZ63DRAFT_57382 [Mariannaea sp. PMI_226]|nr:hypothetical protein BGZ63DRAFT_57382 [Mariannaea sp. PMI_226]